MKKTIAILCSVILIGIGFYGCKKGPKDPFISLHSRDKRIMAAWTVSSISTTTVTVNNGNTINNPNYQNTTTTETTSFDGSTLSSSTSTDYSGNPTPTTTHQSQTQTFSTTISLTLGKNGDAKATETMSSLRSQTLATTPTNTCTPGFSTPGQTCDGTWTNTAAAASTTYTYEGTWRWGTDNKNKDEVIIDLGASQMTGTYLIDELKNKEMVFKISTADGAANSGTSNASNNTTVTGTITLTGSGK